MSDNLSWWQRELTPEEQNRQQLQGGLVWQPYAMGGGHWVTPQVVRVSDEDVDRIARAVVRLLREDQPAKEQRR